MVVEDDADLLLAITTHLTGLGMLVDGAGDIATADAALTSEGYDCVVFDRILPDGDAITYVHRRRKRGWAVPVLFLSARGSGGDIVTGFEHGGDDYLVKPCAMAELGSRVIALTRRRARRSSVLCHGDLEVDCARRTVRRAGVLLCLTDKEFALLEHLIARPDQAVGRDELIEHCWNSDTEPMSNAVDATVRRLRAKLGQPDLISTIRGRGYRFGQHRASS
jgi:DNA-binding response OmpR family regulator